MQTFGANVQSSRQQEGESVYWTRREYVPVGSVAASLLLTVLYTDSPSCCRLPGC